MTLPDLTVDNHLTGAPTTSWPHLALRRQAGPAPRETSVELTDGSASLQARDYCSVRVLREGLTVTVSSPAGLSDAEIVHPILAFVGAVVARWTRRSAFHGAAVVVEGRAWVLLAPPGGGKSTLSSTLNDRGHLVLADDLSVIDEHLVLAGPRSCDLRAAAAAHLERGERRETTDQQGRWRDRLEPAPYEVPLGGFVSLAWGERLAARPADVREKLALLATSEALGQGPTTPDSFLRLLDAPAVELSRPRAWSSLDETVELLLDVASR